MAALGLRPGARVAVGSESDLEVAPFLVACLRTGAVLLPLSPEASAAEVEAILGRAQPDLLVADEAAAQGWGLEPGARRWTIAAASWRARLPFRALSKAKPHTLESVLAGVTPARGHALDLDPSRDLLLLATSGSTGEPKLVRVTTGNLIAQAETFARELGMGPGARVLNLSPLVHVDGLTGLFHALWHGATLVRLGRFTVARLPEILHAFYRYRVTHALVVPTLLQLLTRLGEDLRAALATEDLRVIVSTAAPLPETLWRDFEGRTGVPVVNMFGLTETGNFLFTRAGEPTDLGTLGRAVDCEARVQGDDCTSLADGVAGELVVRGPSVSPGYAGEDRPSPWFATGDIVTRDAGGTFRLVGRRKSVIITGGRNVHPEEVDAALIAHPEVIEAVTVGVPDAIWGERVESAVVLRDDSVSLDEVARHVARSLSPYKQPRRLHPRAALPRGQTGKPLRAAIRDALIEAQRASHRDDPRAGLETRVVAIAAELFRVPANTLSATSAPGAPRAWDSLAHLQLVQRLEDTFGIELAPREITRIDSLARAITLVASKL